ncbi:SPFH domain-containing protein [Streptomyces sp. NPDC094034]|uniref:SPFH domain-containing protein n=1 Tax=Streptomyces sp. NPDC094034 TaxID=3155309 RepID=UPI00331B1BDC
MTTTWRPNDDEDDLRGVFTVRRTPPPVEHVAETETEAELRHRPEPHPDPQAEHRPESAWMPRLMPEPSAELSVEPSVEPSVEDTAELVPQSPALDDSGGDGGGERARCPEPVFLGKGDSGYREPGDNEPSDNEPAYGRSVHDEPAHDGEDAPAGRPVLAAFGAQMPAAGAAPFVRTSGHPRWSPLIVGDSTQEIPVHLLFRDEADELEATGQSAGPSLRPTVVGRRWGTGEQPRIRRVPGPAPMPVAPTRTAPPADPKLVERPGPVLPGWAAALVGGLALIACAVVVWMTGAVPDRVSRVLGLPWRPYHGIGLGQWALLVLGVTVVLLAFGGLGRSRVGQAWVLTLFGDYRGSVRRTGLLWVSPLLLRRAVDVRLRHWRSEPMQAVDSNGTALRVVVLVVWRVRDTVRAALGVPDHEAYLREQVEAAMARVLSQLPADAFHDEAPTLRDAEAVGDSLTRMLSAECRPVGVDVFSAQPTRIEYAPEIAEAMRRSRIAAIDAKHRDTVLTSVVDAVHDTVHRLTSRGLVELDDYERKALVKDLTVAFCTGRQGAAEKW